MALSITVNFFTTVKPLRLRIPKHFVWYQKQGEELEKLMAKYQ